MQSQCSCLCLRCHGELGFSDVPRDSPVDRPRSLIVRRQAVGRPRRGAWTCASVVRQSSHHGNNLCTTSVISLSSIGAARKITIVLCINSSQLSRFFLCGTFRLTVTFITKRKLSWTTICIAIWNVLLKLRSRYWYSTTNQRKTLNLCRHLPQTLVCHGQLSVVDSCVYHRHWSIADNCRIHQVNASMTTIDLIINLEQDVLESVIALFKPAVPSLSSCALSIYFSQFLPLYPLPILTMNHIPLCKCGDLWTFVFPPDIQNAKAS